MNISHHENIKVSTYHTEKLTTVRTKDHEDIFSNMQTLHYPSLRKYMT